MSLENIIALSLIILWILRTKKQSFFLSYLWQLKEYRWDRFWDFLRTRQGKYLLFNFLNLVRAVGLVLYLVIQYLGRYRGVIIWYVLLVFILEILLALWEIKEKGFLRPKLTLKALLVLALNGLFLLLGLGFVYFNAGTLYNLAFGLLVLTLLNSILVGLSVFILKPVTYAMKQSIIKRAERKIGTLKNLKVIGITGSYGKSSTKEFLYTILKEKYKVLKTPEHVNTDIGVAKTILNTLDETHEIFIVEMGAYKQGEIKAICDIVKPRFGIITGVSKQHLGLFGSLENILETKFELAQALPENGSLFVNGDCAYCLHQQNGFRGEQIFYSTHERGDLSAREVKVEKDKLFFKVINAGQTIPTHEYSVKLLGAYNISNLLGCIGVAQKLSLSSYEIGQGLSKIEPSKGTMKLHQGLKGAEIIDDTYNANPDGVKLALDHLKYFSGAKKIIVFSHMLELGREAVQLHREVGARLAETGGKVIVTSENYWQELEEGFKSKKEQGIYYLSDPKDVVDELKLELNEQTVVLLEGRMSNVIFESILSNT